jgi:hypothetical protein
MRNAIGWILAWSAICGGCGCGGSSFAVGSAGDALRAEAGTDAGTPPDPPEEAAAVVPEAMAEASAPEAAVEADAGALADPDAAQDAPNGLTVLPDPNCPVGAHTTVSGTVYDQVSGVPAAAVTVFAPKSATLPALPTMLTPGVSCDALYPPLYGITTTDATGHFVLDNVPPGTQVPVVIQTCMPIKRQEFLIASVTKCVDNPQPDRSLVLP